MAKFTIWEPRANTALTADLFLLNPTNKEILEGRGVGSLDTSTSGVRLLISMTVLVLVCLLLAVFASHRFLIEIFSMITVCLGPLWVLVIRMAWNIRRNHRLLQDGRILKGETVIYSSRFIKNSEFEHYEVTLRYMFFTPDKQRIEAQTQETRTPDDFVKTLWPKPGTPVAILYVSPKLYYLL